MSLNPLRTLWGRLLLVTIAAIAVSHFVAFTLFSEERSRAFRHEAESAMAQRIADVADRIGAAQPSAQDEIARSASNRGFRFSIADQSVLAAGATGGGATGVANAISSQLGNVEVRAAAHEVTMTWRRRLNQIRDPNGDEGPIGPPPGAAGASGDGMRMPFSGDNSRRGPNVTEMIVDVALGPGRWLHTRAFLPLPQPPPDYLWVGALASMIAVGLGAALIARQINRPLADLSRAAERLGFGDPNVVVPLSGPEDVRHASMAFNAMAERLGRQMSRQRQMLWALSHDLRTPITALRLRAELIEDEAARQRLLAPLAEMETLTEQALDLARAGASEEKRSHVDLAEIAQTLCGELQDLGVNVRAETTTPIVVECRPSEIARAMRNLGENAARHGGGGIMKVYKNSSGEAIVEVIDKGCGLPADVLAQVTQPFFRADSARGESGGAGLGLAITQAIADSHGGKLLLENRLPRGLSAKLVLPS